MLSCLKGGRKKLLMCLSRFIDHNGLCANLIFIGSAFFLLRNVSQLNWILIEAPMKPFWHSSIGINYIFFTFRWVTSVWQNATIGRLSRHVLSPTNIFRPKIIKERSWQRSKFNRLWVFCESWLIVEQVKSIWLINSVGASKAEFYSMSVCGALKRGSELQKLSRKIRSKAHLMKNGEGLKFRFRLFWDSPPTHKLWIKFNEMKI